MHLDAMHEVTENGDSIGYDFKIDDSRHVWCGEISRRMFEEQLDDFQKDICGGSDMGWFIVLYDDSRPRGGQSEIIARVLDEESGKMLAGIVAAGIRSINQ